MKKYLIGTVILLLCIVIGLLRHIYNISDELKIAEANIKSYNTELSNSTNKNTALQLTVELLNYFNDSILLTLNSTRKELKIKDKNLKFLLLVKSEFIKKDTIKILLTDTLFKEPSLDVDTLIGDEWYNLLLGLKYPSTVIVNPTFKSEKHIIVSNKKETVNPPKRFFLFRWFLKKHIVLNIDIVEKNPYMELLSSKFVEIIK